MWAGQIKSQQPDNPPSLPLSFVMYNIDLKSRSCHRSQIGAWSRPSQIDHRNEPCMRRCFYENETWCWRLMNPPRLFEHHPWAVVVLEIEIPGHLVMLFVFSLLSWEGLCIKKRDKPIHWQNILNRINDTTMNTQKQNKRQWTIAQKTKDKEELWITDKWHEWTEKRGAKERKISFYRQVKEMKWKISFGQG